jgi:hypothetical protein
MKQWIFHLAKYTGLFALWLADYLSQLQRTFSYEKTTLISRNALN